MAPLYWSVGQCSRCNLSMCIKIPTERVVKTKNSESIKFLKKSSIGQYFILYAPLDWRFLWTNLSHRLELQLRLNISLDSTSLCNILFSSYPSPVRGSGISSMGFTFLTLGLIHSLKWRPSLSILPRRSTRGCRLLNNRVVCMPRGLVSCHPIFIKKIDFATIGLQGDEVCIPKVGTSEFYFHWFREKIS